MQLATYDYALLPVYAALAYRVYKHTPRLNDPVGARMGCKTFDTASTRQFHLMLAGDSSAVGVGVATQAQATMGRLLSKLSHAKPAIQALHWQLTAQTGSTSFDLLKQLYALPQQPINLLIIHIGVNDVIALTKRTHWQTNIRHIIELATRKFGTAIIFASLPPMQLMPALPYPLNHFLGRQAQILDHDLRCICANYPQTLYLRLDFNKARFKPNILFAKDGFHPSAITYDYWTDVLSRVILSAYL